MLKRNRPALEVLSVSALDLFASSLGVFILLAIILFPYYLKRPSVEAILQGAEAQMAAAGASLSEARRHSNEMEDRKARAEARRNRAVSDLEQAEAAEAEAQQIAQRAAARATDAETQKQGEAENLATLSFPDLDLVFVMDTTGSMDDELNDVRANMLGIVRVLSRLAPSLHVGFVGYRDRGEAYVTRSFGLTPMNNQSVLVLRQFLDRLNANGGGDTPELVGAGLAKALSMRWRPAAEQRIVVIGDAPAHRSDWNGILSEVARFHARGGGQAPGAKTATRRLSAIFTGRNRPGLQFFQALAQAGAGDFVAHRGRMAESVLLSVLEPRPR